MEKLLEALHDAFGVRVTFDDGTVVDVPLSFDYSDLDTEAFVALVDQVGVERAAVAAIPLYLQVVKEVPDLSFSDFFAAVGPLLEGQGEVEMINVGEN